MYQRYSQELMVPPVVDDSSPLDRLYARYVRQRLYDRLGSLMLLTGNAR